MSEEESAADWAQLVCLTDTETPPFLIAKDEFTIGRARGCDVSHENNKLVSGTHCYILRDDSGKVWLYDTSTNGTLLNSKIKLSKGECREIEHGDEFYVVHKKGEEHVNIGYVFQDLARLKEEEEEEDTAELDQTLEYADEEASTAAAAAAEATLLDDSINREEEEEEETRASVKRRRNSASNPSSKRIKTDRQTDLTSPAAATTTATATATAKPASDTTKDKDTEQQPASKLTDKEPEKDGKGGEENGGDEKKGEGKEGEKAGGKKSDGGEKEAKEGKEEEEEDAFADTLTCIICQELLYDCVSLQPCMHSFCAGCYSGWMAHSTECPSCRGKVDRINKNHIVNNLVEAYLKEHPEKRRPEEDRKDLDAKNKITRDMLYPSRKRASSSEYESSEEEEEEEDRPRLTPMKVDMGTIFGFGTPLFGAANNAYRAQCRQCPGSKPSADTGTGCGASSCSTTTASTAAAATASGSSSNNNNNNNNNDTNNNTAQQPTTSGAGPSGEVDYQERDKKTMPEAPPYTCRGDQNHVLCQCCLQIFPDCRATNTVMPGSSPQQCTVCYRTFCHAFWGCLKADCNGCLARFADLTFGRKVLTGLILNNGHESDIFSNYLDSKRLAVRDVLAECITKLEAGEFSCPDQMRYNITGQTPLCLTCGLRNFQSLAYQYRAQIPRDQLPAAVTARPDCYWGKNCFTQTSKPAHAMRFNHVCEQTRR